MTIRRRFKVSASLLTAFLLSSCVGTSVPKSIVESRPVVSVSGFLIRGHHSFDSTMPGRLKSIVLFTDRNNSRNKKFCEAFVRLAPLEVAEQSGIAADFAPVYWLLNQQVESRADCDQLLRHYDYQMANLYLQRYGQALSKGPVLVAVDKNGKFAYVDVARASGDDIRKVVFDWGTMMQKSGMQNVTITSPTFLQNLAGLFCNTTTQMVAVRTPPTGADPTNPATYGFDPATGHWSKPSVWKIGANLVGGTITGLACTMGALIS